MTRRIILIFVVFLFCFMLFGLIRQIQRALLVGTRLDKAIQTYTTVENNNRKLQKELGYVHQEEFIEEQSRNTLNLALPNETIVFIDPSEVDRLIQIQEPVTPLQMDNWQGWLKLLWN